MLHVYSTTAEALKIIAISRFKDPAKLFLLRGIKIRFQRLTLD